MLKKGLFKKPLVKLEPGGVNIEINIEDETLCASCKNKISVKLLEQLNFVCPTCSHNHRIDARKRIMSIFDNNSFQEWDFSENYSADYSFPGYAEKIVDARKKSGEPEAVISGRGRILGLECAVFAMDHQFLMGSMGTAVGEHLTCTFERAQTEGLPVIGFTLSGGARMQEGILSLMQMAKVSAAVRRHSDCGLLYIAVLTDPTAGGVTASFAMQADMIFAEPGALICFAGPRVIEQTIRQKLPEGFQRAEFLLSKGFIDKIVDRNSQRSLFAQILEMHNTVLK